ncbi:hypothetical protein PoB_002511100 [Plakobranchus ocellatus]|uniref:Uncharacterized protein n=1 Tax=Plakobranchus ocellatus TaxID=259542 RepID=A0AAV3ZVP3_9GAST|nr:hypothetical protein PoB_002511100 [Plakobranchus ocellatus]
MLRDLQERFCCGLESRHRRPRLTEDLKARDPLVVDSLYFHEEHQLLRDLTVAHPTRLTDLRFQCFPELNVGGAVVKGHALKSAGTGSNSWLPSSRVC